jgi:hypothetical protein
MMSHKVWSTASAQCRCVLEPHPKRFALLLGVVQQNHSA